MQPLLLLRGLFVSVLLALLFHASQLRAQEFEVEGLIQEHIIQPGPGWTNSAAFKVYVRDCAWLIEITETNSSGTKQRRVGSMDGTEMFQITSWSNSAPLVQVTNLPGKRYLNLVHTDEGLVVSNSLPVGTIYDRTYNDALIPHLWVMFASQCYFKTQNVTNRLMPVYDVDPVLVDRVDLRMEAEWELMNGKIPLPLRVVYYNPGWFYTMNTNKEVKSMDFPVPYRGGFTDAIYAVTTMTNFDGVTFPAGFTFGEFMPGSGPSRYNLRVRKTAEAVVTAFRPTCSRKDLLPEIHGTTGVQDLRLAHATPPVASVVYELQKGDRWSPVPRSGHYPIGRAMFYVLLALPSVALIYFLFKAKQK
jgi:hypothetical protein